MISDAGPAPVGPKVSKRGGSPTRRDVGRLPAVVAMLVAVAGVLAMAETGDTVTREVVVPPEYGDHPSDGHGGGRDGQGRRRRPEPPASPRTSGSTLRLSTETVE